MHLAGNKGELLERIKGSNEEVLVQIGNLENIECLGLHGTFRELRKPNNAEAELLDELQGFILLEKPVWDQRAAAIPVSV